MKIVATCKFSDNLHEIKNTLELAKKDYFQPDERIVIKQDIDDEYPYIDGPGEQLIQIQKIVSRIGISNNFILIETPNEDIDAEVKDVAKYYSLDDFAFDFKIVSGNYNKKIKQYENTACKKMWNHLYVGTDNNTNPCCLADHRFPIGNIFDQSVDNIIQTDSAQKIRNFMTNGYRTRACRICYEKEDNGVYSPRQRFNPSNEDVCVTHLDIRLSNTCNFKCRMCSEYFSSSIQKETVLIYGKDAVLGVENNSLEQKTKRQRHDAYNKIVSSINENVKSIYFAGGEPLLMEEHYLILQHLIDIKNTDLEIRYNTNCSILNFKNFNILDLWQNFPNVTIGISIDGSDKVAEYIRHGTHWEQIIQNINKIKQQATHVNCKVESTVGFLNIENLINLQTRWIRSKYFSLKDFSVGLLNGELLNVACAPAHHKHRLTKIIYAHIKFLGTNTLSQQWKDVLKYMNNNDFSYSLNDFKTRMQTLDRYRNESFVDVFPEFKDLY